MRRRAPFSHVVIVLDDDVRLFAASAPPSATFRVNDLLFRENTADLLEITVNVTGFHDWLHGRWGRVVGVRFIPIGSLDALKLRLGLHAAVRVVPGFPGIEIKFVPSAPWQTWTDAQQILSDCRIFTTNGSAVALVFPTEYAERSLRRLVSGHIS